MLRNGLGIFFIAQLLVIAAIFGLALKDQKEYRIPFGKLFLPLKLQVALCIWLMISLFCNVLFVYWM